MPRQLFTRLDNSNDNRDIKHVFVLKTGVTGGKNCTFGGKGLLVSG